LENRFKGTRNPVVSKSLIIGLGGAGIEYIKNIGKRIVDEFRSLNGIPVIDFLAVDTDCTSLEQMCDADAETGVSKDKSLHCAVRDVYNIRDNPDLYGHIHKWAPDIALSNDIVTGTGGVRSRGKLAFVWNYEKIRGKIIEILDKIDNRSVDSGIEPRFTVNGGITVYVIGSLFCIFDSIAASSPGVALQDCGHFYNSIHKQR